MLPILAPFALACSIPAFSAVAIQSDAGGWTLIERAGGSNSCAARRSGSDVDTILMLSQRGQLILVAGRADWHVSGAEEVNVRIDNFELRHMQADIVDNLLLLPIADEQVVIRLRAAKDLYWSLSFGSFHAVVDGLGDALDRLRTCDRQLSHSPSK